MWERGLKQANRGNQLYFGGVAPHVGAWIETPKSRMKAMPDTVAPHVGAWIETSCLRKGEASGMSLPMWERGLKLVDLGREICERESLPMWERRLSKFAPNVTYAEGDRLW